MIPVTGIFVGALPIALLFAGMIEELGLGTFLVEAGENIGLVVRWILISSGVGFLLALIFGMVFGLFFGGFAVIQHFVLRFILWRKGHLPWDLARFLDYAAERIFLRKVGGGYIFIHRLVLEHFARLGETGETG